eukprot:6988013-Alexandrium_andersonii.AAC.1
MGAWCRGGPHTGARAWRSLTLLKVAVGAEVLPALVASLGCCARPLMSTSQDFGARECRRAH